MPLPQASPSASGETARTDSDELLAARQAGDSDMLGRALIREAQAHLDQSAPQFALGPLQEAVRLANETGDDRLGREAAILLAQAHDSLGDAAAAASWNALADGYRQRISQSASDAPTTETAGTLEPTIGGASPAAPDDRAATGTASTFRHVGLLLAVCALLLLAWWHSRRRAAALSDEAKALSRQQRQLRSAHNQLKQQSETLRQMAVQDALTGTMNRQSFAAALQELLTHAEAQRQSVALFVFDLDHFKDINDQYGHLAGDGALKTLVGIVRENLDSADLFGRFGGDEFLISHATQDSAHSLALAERIRAAVVSRSTAAGPGRPPLTVSIGIAHATPASGYTLEDLFHRADTALYAAKRAGRNRAVLEDLAHPAPPGHQPALRSLT
ncbi:GGDEF domain-containing protein [Arenimonas sp.]|uniref:GGDEF domain-containing protein n=1 Tax=Arenimonas sp. TaxID=1872635 RepID=UPI0039E6D41A